MRLGQSIIAAILLLAAPAPSIWAEETFYPVAPAARPDAPWCAPDAPWVPNLYQPDGALIAVGSRVFRVCKGAVDPHGERVLRLLFNPRKVEGLQYDASMSTLTISDLVPGDKWIENMLRYQRLIGTRTFGGVTYQEYDHWELEGDDRLLSSLFLYNSFLNEGRTELPPHAISCPDKSRRPNGGASCSVFVFYKDIRAITSFIGDMLGLAPVPREKFPEIAQDMWRALQTADVTNQLDDLRQQLPMLD